MEITYTFRFHYTRGFRRFTDACRVKKTESKNFFVRERHGHARNDDCWDTRRSRWGAIVRFLPRKSLNVLFLCNMCASIVRFYRSWSLNIDVNKVQIKKYIFDTNTISILSGCCTNFWLKCYFFRYQDTYPLDKYPLNINPPTKISRT